MAHRIPLGPFQLHRRIGRGGMGEVWEGVHVAQAVPVAVKILTGEAAQRAEYVEAFRNEVRGLAGLSHPGIVTVLDYGEMPAGAAKLSEGLFRANSPYIVMEFARQGSLEKYLNELGWFEVKAIVLTVLDALAHAHAAGVVHRDLKPANILLGCGSDDAPGIKLTDFGLVHAIDQHEYAGSHDAGWGTPAFMAPEQFRGAWRDYGPWTDLYSLGVMTHLLCAGEYPFHAGDSTAWARAHQVVPPRELKPRFPIPDGLQDWVARLLMKNPRDRFRYAADASWALQRLGDPRTLVRRRQTVAIAAPAVGQAPTESTVRSTAGWRAATGSSGQTLVDRPPTTQLVDVEIAEDVNDDAGPAYVPDVPPLPYRWERTVTADTSLKLVGAGLGLFGIRSLPMVDRNHERDVLWEALRTVRDSGTARAVIVRGRAGTGKSRLAQWLQRRAHEVGSAVCLRTMFSPVAGPGDGLSRMIAQHLRAGGMDVSATVSRVDRLLRRIGVSDDEEISAMTRFIMPLGATSPELSAIGTPARGADARYGLLLRHLRRLGDRRPVVVWFDDVQWGADALAFTQHVLARQHNTPTPILFVLTARDEALQLRPVETRLLDEVNGFRHATTLRVEPLKDEDTEQLVRQMLLLTPDLARDVARRSAGNPLFATQLVGDWVAGGKLAFGADGFALKRGVEADIPDDMHAMWRERLAIILKRRPVDDLVALEIAAALGASVELEEWYLACGKYGVAAPTDLVRELLESGLAVQTDYGFDFCHGLFRESLVQSSHNDDRQDLVNIACVRMLEERYPAQRFPFAERFAQHVIAAGELSLAIGPLWAAARARVDRSEFPVASGLLDQRDQILETLAVSDDDRAWCLGWVARAQISLWQGHYHHVDTYASKAAEQARRSGWPDLVAKASLVAGLATYHLGDLDHAQTSMIRAQREFLRLDDGVGAGQCLLGLGRIAHGRANHDAAREYYTQARQTCVEARYQLGEAQCLNALGDLARDMEAWEEARRYALQAQSIFEELENAIGVADCVNDLAELDRRTGELEDARDGCVDALRRYEALGSEHSMHVRVNLALTLELLGSEEEARAMLEEVRVRFEQTEQFGPRAVVDLLILPMLLRAGEVELAKKRFESARDSARKFAVRDRDASSALAITAELLAAADMPDFARDVREFRDRAAAFNG